MGSEYVVDGERMCRSIHQTQLRRSADGNVAAPSRRTSPIGSKEKRPVGIGAAKRAGVRKLRRRNGYAPWAITGSGDVFRCLGPKVPQALGTPCSFSSFSYRRQNRVCGNTNGRLALAVK
jgi:hypothetical protein